MTSLMKTYAVTGDELWLERRYTLYTVDVGAALFAQSCLEVDPRFPTMDVW